MKVIRDITIYLTFLFGAVFLTNAQGVNISSGGKIVVSGAAKMEIEDGNFTNNGSYTKDTDTLIFRGTSAGVIDGSTETDFHEVQVENTGGVTLETNATTVNLTVVSGGEMDVTAGVKLSVSGVLTNSGGDTGLEVLSDASSSGELQVTGTASGNVTYQRYLTHSAWHLLSAPFAGMSIHTFVTEAGNSIASNAAMYGLAPYDNDAKDWTHYTSDGGNPASGAGSFVSGKAYEVLRATSSGTVALTGTVVTSDVSIGVTEGTSNSWNLIGNPFSTSINANDDADAVNNFLTVNTAALHDSYEAVYIWDPSSSSYITVNHVYASNTAFYLAPTQGFFVYSVAGGDDVDFTEAMQAGASGVYYKKLAKQEDLSLRLKLSKGSKTVSTQLYFLENASTELDPGYDAGRFGGSDNSFVLYTQLVGDAGNKVQFDIQSLPLYGCDYEVPIGIVSGPEDLIFSAEVKGNGSAGPFVLEDRLLDRFIKLHEGESYEVTLSESTSGTGRFFLHRKSVSQLTAANDRDELRVRLFPVDKELHVMGAFDAGVIVHIVDLSGKVVKKEVISSGGSVTKIALQSLQEGVYIARLISGGRSYHHKFFLGY